jgi:hypothetical protein
MSNDIFDELQYYYNNKTPINIIPPTYPTPPTSPTSPLSHTYIEFPTRLTLLIPENTYTISIPDTIQNNLQLSKEYLLISSKLNTKLYKQPPEKSYDARKIWICAQIPSNATIRQIEIKLLDWAFIDAFLIIENNIIKSIKWNTYNGYCTSTWNTFLKWIICASVS